MTKHNLTFYDHLMNPEAQAELNRILQKGPDNLNPEEAVFLKARKTYLNKMQLEDYAGVLETKPPVKEPVKKDVKQTN